MKKPNKLTRSVRRKSYSLKSSDNCSSREFVIVTGAENRAKKTMGIRFGSESTQVKNKTLKKESESHGAKRSMLEYMHLKHLFPKSINFRIYAHMVLAIETKTEL
ncbi:hypothetical protein C5167_024422 [Papaver somniferum]|uniref:Uncharacterized protein n=1 Tax=Papaver somniferum TaxID=3469 RepID=A0A4Y7JQ34_PAPSO|nr:hypothetical protein C5167_024422 [Papaver somniferum]